ncbi:MAG: hypothetical protein OXT73_10590 [Bacteroidota bacterium]|nr:hypothetical protein [Bacteroidota bacterium]
MTPINIRVTAYPTVEWLRQCAADRQPLSRPADRLVDVRPSRVQLLAGILRPMLGTETRIEEDKWVATPDGELPVDLVMYSSDRRIAVCCSPRWYEECRGQDALSLVYGGFDMLVRIQLNSDPVDAVDAAWAIMNQVPSAFSNFGRLSLGRRASEEIRKAGANSCAYGSESVGVRVMRLHVATDWVRAFENALRGGESLPLSA